MRISIPDHLLERDGDLGRMTVTLEMIRAYARAVGDPAAYAETLSTAPPTFCLAMRRGMTPEIQLPPELFGVYGGHDLEFHRPVCAGETYHIIGRVSEVYEKIGRSGPLTVIVREALVRDGSGQLAARIVERQIVRRRPAGAPIGHAGHPPIDHGGDASVSGQHGARREPQQERHETPREDATTVFDLGHELGPRRRPTPDAAQIASYVGAADIAEPMFTEPPLARALGYRGLVVPGPLLTAYLEQFVRAELPGWRLERLSTTFRVPTIAGDLMVLRGVVTERHAHADGEHLVCDLIIEHADGERAVTSTATLHRERG